MSDPLAGQALNVQELKRMADAKETAKLKEVLARRQKEEDEEKRARQDFMEREFGLMASSASTAGPGARPSRADRKLRSCAFPRSTVRTTAGRSTASRRADRTR